MLRAEMLPPAATLNRVCLKHPHAAIAAVSLSAHGGYAMVPTLGHCNSSLKETCLMAGSCSTLKQVYEQLPMGNACRISKLHQFFRARELMVHVNIRHIAAFKFAVLVLGVAHWVGCLFYFLARLAGFSSADNSATWLQQFDTGTPMDYTCANNGTIFDLYGVTLYKGLNGISNLGYDPVVPERQVFLFLR